MRARAARARVCVCARAHAHVRASLAIASTGADCAVCCLATCVLQALTVVDKGADGSLSMAEVRQVKMAPLVPPYADKPPKCP